MPLHDDDPVARYESAFEPAWRKLQDRVAHRREAAMTSDPLMIRDPDVPIDAVCAVVAQLNRIARRRLAWLGDTRGDRGTREDRVRARAQADAYRDAARYVAESLIAPALMASLGTAPDDVITEAEIRAAGYCAADGAS